MWKKIARGDIWIRKSIPQPADPTTTQTLNILYIWTINKYLIYDVYGKQLCVKTYGHMDEEEYPQPVDPTTQTLNI